MAAILNTEEFKHRLLAEEKSLTSMIHTAGTNARDLSDGPSARDWSDASVRDEEKDGQLQEADIDLTTLNRVRDALKRIEAGTFGQCLVDGGPIEEKRLRAIPWTPYCLKHEQLQEQERPRRIPTL
jgi:RNA polymerase-binding transcription factor DksA